MNQTLVECERVDERLQSRTGRAWTARPIDLSLDLRVEEISRADLREHVHVSDINEHCRGILKSATAIFAKVILDSSLNQLLFL